MAKPVKLEHASTQITEMDPTSMGPRCSVAIAFWNLGWLQTRLEGRKTAEHICKLSSQVRCRWWAHSLDAVHLCEAGRHLEGLQDTNSKSVEAIIGEVKTAIQAAAPTSSMPRLVHRCLKSHWLICHVLTCSLAYLHTGVFAFWVTC